MNAYEIPLDQGSKQLTVLLNKVAYVLTIIWRNDLHSGFYSLDIGLPEGGQLLGGVPIVTGADLLEQYQHKIKGRLLVTTADGDSPTYAGLGTLTKLYWVDA